MFLTMTIYTLSCLMVPVYQWTLTKIKHHCWSLMVNVNKTHGFCQAAVVLFSLSNMTFGFACSQV